ncbi:MAG: DUF91 domain-containing protein [Planctomycetes bacterium]|nr:DUF91 domain-containing protein [Planctomycetota bacterium]
MDTIGLWQIGEAGPSRLQTAELSVERDLEDWIERDPGLLERGLVIVGRQIRLEGGPLDLLALDPQGRWVLVEIKRERLRREVLAQAIDYASCLHAAEPGWLRGQCDEYLRSKGSPDTLDSLLDQRGRTLDDDPDGREVVIYLVGTGLDPGLERMVGYLAERAELAVRMVTFTAFRDAGGKSLLARKIHEATDETSAAPLRTANRSPAAETILSLADGNGVGGVMRTMYEAATTAGLHVRPWYKSIMYAPPANKVRCLFVVWVYRQRQQGVAKAYIASEAFEQFYGIKEADLIAAVGPVGNVMLDQAAADRFAAGLRRLMAPRENG